MSDDWVFATGQELARLLRLGELSPLELTQGYLDRIERFDAQLHSFITTCPERAIRQATALMQEMPGDNPLWGLPVTHKDVLWTQDVRTTAHSRAMEGELIPEDAEVVRYLEEAGTILLGKTNTTEFADGGSEVFGTPANPWSLGDFTGGSSAGSCSAVAAGLTVLATGTDTGGSIRAPASFCGVAGLKPTHGRVSVHGLLPLSWSMDHVGPIARSVTDVGAMLNRMVTVKAAGENFVPQEQHDLKGLVVGLPRQHFFADLHPEVDRLMQAALRQVEELGAQLVEVDLPRAGDLAAAGAIIVSVESFARHARRLRARGREYGTRSRREISSGAFYSAADYQDAEQIRGLWNNELDHAMQSVDCLITPTLNILPFSIAVQETGPPDTSWGTRHFNFSGHPALTIPGGFADTGVPIGMQWVGHYHGEAALLQSAYTFECARPWQSHYRRLMEVGS